jgi:hypothetical protein
MCALNYRLLPEKEASLTFVLERQES